MPKSDFFKAHQNPQKVSHHMADNADGKAEKLSSLTFSRDSSCFSVLLRSDIFHALI